MCWHCQEAGVWRLPDGFILLALKALTSIWRAANIYRFRLVEFTCCSFFALVSHRCKLEMVNIL